jgi:hypothetical protein
MGGSAGIDRSGLVGLSTAATSTAKEQYEDRRDDRKTACELARTDGARIVGWRRIVAGVGRALVGVSHRSGSLIGRR